jgi:16S rRNA G527 N7-methylase RsmG
VVRQLHLAAEVEAVRYQNLAPSRAGFDLVTARALGGYGDLLEWARDRMAPEGVALVWTGPESAQELAGLPGWDVLICPLSCAGHSRLVRLRPCFT